MLSRAPHDLLLCSLGRYSRRDSMSIGMDTVAARVAHRLIRQPSRRERLMAEQPRSSLFTHVILTVLEQTINTLRQLACRGHDRFAAAVIKTTLLKLFNIKQT